jgi:glycosyltransferase involved in cell wall biosynthesis
MRIAVLTDDRVGSVMAGSAIRAFEMAKALAAAGHAVRLAAAPGSHTLEGDEHLLVEPTPWRWPNAVVSPAWSLPPRAFFGRHLLIADGVTPLLAELAELPSTADVVHRRRTAAARLPLVAARADAILVAGPAQVEWWSRHVRRRFGTPFLNVPFGIPEDPRFDERDQIPDVPGDWAVVLWWGGVWPWLDLETLLAARARLGAVPLSVVVPTAPRPGTEAAPFSAADLDAAAQKHGLVPPQVVALDRWVPYHRRHRVLNRASLIAVLHRPSDEATLSFRTRALDGVWAGVPLLLTEGGEVARLARKHGWGGLVPPGDVEATAAAMQLLLGEREQLRVRSAIATSRDEWRWSRVVEPLLDTLPTLPAAHRSSLAGALIDSARALLVPPGSEVWR